MGCYGIERKIIRYRSGRWRRRTNLFALILLKVLLGLHFMWGVRIFIQYLFNFVIPAKA